MKWDSKTPTKPGYYWCKIPGNEDDAWVGKVEDPVVLVDVRPMLSEGKNSSLKVWLFGSHTTMELNDPDFTNCVWLGPLVEPR